MAAFIHDVSFHIFDLFFYFDLFVHVERITFYQLFYNKEPCTYLVFRKKEENVNPQCEIKLFFILILKGTTRQSSNCKPH